MQYRVVIAALLLSGCAPVGPDFVRPDAPVNPAWLDAELEQYAAESENLAEWWTLLNDPVLNELIDTAHRQNNNIKIAGLRVIEAQANLQIATGNRYPQTQVLAGNATAVSKSKRDLDTIILSDLNYTQLGVGASVSWEIDFWGKFRRGIEAADAGLLASIASYDEAMVVLTATVADVYVIIRAIEEQLRLAQDSLKIQERSYEIVQVLYRHGSSSELDALQAKTLLLSTQAVVPQLELSLRQAKNALSVLMGMAPTDVSALLGSSSTLPSIPASIGIGIPADLLRQRPDVRRAEMQARAQNAAVGIATASLYPSFSLSGSLGLTSTEGSSTSQATGGVENLFGSDSIAYSFGPSFVWPFLNYGRIRNSIRVQDARLQQSLINYREVVIQAARETEDALASLQGTQQQDVILAEGVKTAQRSAELSFLRYQEGFADYQRVLNAQQSLFTQQQRYASNRGAVISSLIALYRSLGGGWQADTPRDYVDEATQMQMEERTNWGDMLDVPVQQP